jgi:hypothetical protein
MPPLGAWTAWRDARPIAPLSFRELWREQDTRDNRNVANRAMED